MNTLLKTVAIGGIILGSMSLNAQNKYFKLDSKNEITGKIFVSKNDKVLREATTGFEIGYRREIVNRKHLEFYFGQNANPTKEKTFPCEISLNYLYSLQEDEAAYLGIGACALKNKTNIYPGVNIIVGTQGQFRRHPRLGGFCEVDFTVRKSIISCALKTGLRYRF